MPYKILVADPIASEGTKLLGKQADVDVRVGLKPAELLSIIGEYDALVVRSQTKVTAQVIEAGKKLQVIGRAGVGVDNIDVEAATQRGIVVVNAPAGNAIAAAEHTIALMLALARHIPQAHALLTSGVWERSRFEGIEIKGKVLGIIGLGNVGTAVARRAEGLEMQVIAYDPFISSEYARNLKVRLVSLEELLKTADIISLHVPLTTQTKVMIGARELAMVKPTARIINVARGGLIDEDALLRALEEGRLAGAALDVFQDEPVKEHPLFHNPKVIVTPHLGASTTEAQVEVSIDVAEQVFSVLQGGTARYCVNAPLIPAELVPVLGPYVKVATLVGRLVAQLSEGQLNTVRIFYEGEIADCDTAALKAAVLGGLLETVSEERVNLVNANLVAQKRGLKIVEQKSSTCENFASCLAVEAISSAGSTAASGTFIREEPHIVRVNDYWIDIVPTGGYFLFADHHDRPGFIGAVGTLTGKVDINIHSMHLSRLKPRGKALVVLGLDEPLTEEMRHQVLALPDVQTAKLVKL